jgi:hypothetical protein
MVETTTTMTVTETVTAMQPAMAESQQTIPYEQNTLASYEQNRADMACSLDNPDACEACGS